MTSFFATHGPERKFKIRPPHPVAAYCSESVPPAHELRGELHFVNGSAEDCTPGGALLRGSSQVDHHHHLSTRNPFLQSRHFDSLPIDLGVLTCGAPAALLKSAPPVSLMVRLTSLKIRAPKPLSLNNFNSKRLWTADTQGLHSTSPVRYTMNHVKA
jgi:hypothetical protein